MTSPADRGKKAEKLVKAHLDKLSLRADFANYRLPDARAGSFQATLADFLVVRKGVPILLEVKQTQHEYRLSHQNFGLDQVARMRRFQSAGSRGLVLIYHSTLNIWRLIELDYFYTREGGSWDLRNVPTVKLEELFKD